MQNPDYPDLMYVSELIGRDVLNTMPEHTRRAFADHGEIAGTLDADPEDARRMLIDAGGRRDRHDQGGRRARARGVQSFCDSYHQLLDCVQSVSGL